ncbi:S8 family peptidase [Sporosarcina sp. NPDC096371]|uniref:S8 family peptidase n=1 Tax=Sporosarcina sp. NPDC096371 TaxID=3364530 RepID=UPI00381AE0C5
MKKTIFACLLALFIVLPLPVHADDKTDYLLSASKSELAEIQEKFPHFTRVFDLLSMMEIPLTASERRQLEKNYPDVQVFPINTYKATALTDSIPKQFSMLKATPDLTTPYTGKGVKVALIDSGIDVSHPDLKVAGGICTLPKEDCAIGTPYDDDFGHGTHVAGIIAGQNKMGIAPNVELYAIKTIDKHDVGRTTDIIAGVEWAIKNDIEILNMSITTNRDDPALKLMLEKAYQKGMILVAAAGNEEIGNKIDAVQYPAKYPTVIAVSAITPDKRHLFESSIGPEVELAAPGSGIISTFPKQLDDDGEQDGYKEMSGTSMASPHVTGIIALLKERFPDISNTKLRAILANAAEDIGESGRDKEFGYGLVQYPVVINEKPALSHYVDRGKITIELSNADDTTERKLMIGDHEIKELSPGKWELYRFAGTHIIDVTFTNSSRTTGSDQLVIPVKGIQYKDVNSDKWYAGQIAYLAHNKKIQGYLDQTFRPDQLISRAEAVALVGRVLDLNGEQRTGIFKDVSPSNFASGYIQSAVEEGLVAGFEDGTFRPNDAVTRAEMSLLLQSAFHLQANVSKPSDFSDVTSNLASYEAILALTQAKIVQGYPDGTFKPQHPMTRATFSVFLAGAERPDLFQQ